MLKFHSYNQLVTNILAIIYAGHHIVSNYLRFKYKMIIHMLPPKRCNIIQDHGGLAY